MQYAATIEVLESGRFHKYAINNNGTTLSFAEVLTLWMESPDFCEYFSQLLAASELAGFRWETPGLSRSNSDQPFQFVLISAPGFTKRSPDSSSYQEYFTDDNAAEGVVAFPNLGRNAILVVPSPRTEITAYGHLAAFVRRAPGKQVRALWREVSRAVLTRLDDDAIWLSTAGGGVAWLHVRIDSSPKYYGYATYKTV